MTESKSGARWPLAAWLIISQLITLATLPFWLMGALMSVMAFDNGVEFWNMLFVGAVWLYPVWALGLAVAGWVAFARKKNTAAWVLTSLTFLPFLVIYALVVLG